LGKGCQRWRVVANEFYDIGAGGIRLGETAKRSEAFELSRGHLVSDNHLHELGRVYAPAVGLIIFQRGENRIAHNHIHDLDYTAISVGWNWGYQETPCHHNLIEFNHLHDVGRGVLSDLGGIYTLGIQKGTVLRNNLIHDVKSHSYGGWGLYTDEGSSDIVLENNVVYRCKSAGFHQHYGRENIVRNNIFAFGAEHQLMRSREEEHVSFIFTNNIVYFESGTLLGSTWKNDRYVMDHNIYWNAGSSAASITMAGVTLPEWRQRGHDLHSAIADPLFVAPEKQDFRLRRNSPALKLGFKPIDLSQVGVRRKFRNQVHDTD
jgi:parallel beta-helix repeat protein